MSRIQMGYKGKESRAKPPPLQPKTAIRHRKAMGCRFNILSFFS
jgi:hypothetical protein